MNARSSEAYAFEHETKWFQSMMGRLISSSCNLTLNVTVLLLEILTSHQGNRTLGKLRHQDIVNGDVRKFLISNRVSLDLKAWLHGIHQTFLCWPNFQAFGYQEILRNQLNRAAIAPKEASPSNETFFKNCNELLLSYPFKYTVNWFLFW